ncbi:uncharacterized protein METZ01_LOCUS233888, partial [marine metagenome]
NVLKLNQKISLFSALVTKTLIRLGLLFRIVQIVILLVHRMMIPAHQVTDYPSRVLFEW